MSGSPLLLVPLYLSHLTPLFPPSSTCNDLNGIFLYLNGVLFFLLVYPKLGDKGRDVGYDLLAPGLGDPPPGLHGGTALRQAHRV